MEESHDSINSEFDEAIKSQSDTSLLQPSFLCLLSIKEIIKVCANEFHEGIPLRNNDGIVTNYLPDNLDAYCNSVDQLHTILSPYEDEEFHTNFKNTDSFGKDRDAKRKYYFALQTELMKLMKRINIMPGENSYGIEIVGLTKPERKALEKIQKMEDLP